MPGSGIKSQVLLVESCLATALQHPWGIRIWVGNEQKFKRLFYQVRKANPQFECLSLLTTTSPGEFLIFKETEAQDGSRVEETYD